MQFTLPSIITGGETSRTFSGVNSHFLWNYLQEKPLCLFSDSLKNVQLPHTRIQDSLPSILWNTGGTEERQTCADADALSLHCQWEQRRYWLQKWDRSVWWFELVPERDDSGSAVSLLDHDWKCDGSARSCLSLKTGHADLGNTEWARQLRTLGLPRWRISRCRKQWRGSLRRFWITEEFREQDKLSQLWASKPPSGRNEDVDGYLDIATIRKWTILWRSLLVIHPLKTCSSEKYGVRKISKNDFWQYYRYNMLEKVWGHG